MADKIVSWGGFDSKGVDGMGITGSLSVAGSTFISSSNATQLQVGNNLLFVSSSGTIGIGTTTPNSSYKLDVNGSVNIRNINGINISVPNYGDNSGGSITIYNQGASRALRILGTTGTGWGDILLNPYSGGNIGIGTLTPSYRLDVNGRTRVKGTGTTDATTALLVENANASASMVVLDDGSSTLGFSYANTHIVTGSVSINQSGSNVPLTVNGRNLTSATGNKIFEVIGSAGTSVFSPRSNGLVYISTGQLYFEQNGLTCKYYDSRLHFGTGVINSSSTSANPQLYGGLRVFTWDGASTNTEVFRVAGTGNVSLGFPSTFTNTAKLHISGSSSDNLLRIESPASSSILFVSGSGNVGIGTTSPSQKLDVQGDINVGVSGATTVHAYYNSTTRNQIVYTNNSSFEFHEGVNERVRIAAGSGNVGIGTTTPTSRLQVKGSGTTSATTTFLLQNSTPINLLTVLDDGQFTLNSPSTTFTSPLISLAASQSAFSISHSISASNTVGGQYFGVNITPTFFATTSSQTHTALRVAATFTGSAAATSGSNIIADFGATSVGSQLTVTDITSGSIYMVNDVSGLPILEATSDWTVNMYNFPDIIFQKTGSQINISGSLTVASTSSGQSVLGTGLIVNNEGNSSPINDFQVKTQLYDAIYVTSSADAIALMNNPNGKVGFFGATPTTQSLGWSVTNYLASQSFDANTVTLEQLADVVGTLLVELKSKGLLG